MIRMDKPGRLSPVECTGLNLRRGPPHHRTFLIWLFTACSLCLMTTRVDADTVSTTVTATILPAEPSQNEIQIVPKRIDLQRGEYAKLMVTNDSGQTQAIRIDTVPMQKTNCRLKVTPRGVSLEKDSFQVFRLFYTPAADGSCDVLFKLQVHVGDNYDESIEVKCD